MIGGLHHMRAESEREMSKTIQKPLACRNAHCGAMCSPADAEFYSKLFGNNPRKCYNYEQRDDLYQNNELLDRVKSVRKELFMIMDKYNGTGEEILQVYCDGIKTSLKLIDNLIKSEEKYD